MNIKDYQAIGTDYRTNEQIGTYDEETLRQYIYPIYGTTTVITPLIRLVPGLKAGTVKLHLSETPEYPDVIAVAARLAPNTAEKVVAAAGQHLLHRSFRTVDQLQASTAKHGVTFTLNLVQEDKKDVLRYAVKKSRAKGTAAKYAELMTSIESRLQYLGKMSNITVKHADEQEPEKAPQVVIKEDALEEGAEKLAKAFSTEAFAQFARIIAKMARNVEEANEVLDAIEA